MRGVVLSIPVPLIYALSAEGIDAVDVVDEECLSAIQHAARTRSDFIRFRSSAEDHFFPRNIVDSPDAFKYMTFRQLFNGTRCSQLETQVFCRELRAFARELNNRDGLVLRRLRCEFEQVLELCERGNLKVGIVVDSRSPELLRNWIRDHLPILKRDFVNVVVSSEVGFCKPDCRVYFECLKRMKLKAEQVVGIGVHPEFDCLGLIYSGIRCVRFDAPYLDISESAELEESENLMNIRRETIYSQCHASYSSILDCFSCIQGVWEKPLRRQLKIGYYLNPKKLKKFDTQNVFDFPYRNDIKFEFLDFSDPAVLNIKIDILLLKATDLMNEVSELKKLELLEKYINLNPRLIIVDPLEEVKKVMDRNILNDVINAGNIICLDNSPIKTPSSVLLNSEVLSGWMKDPSSISLKFPLICKPVQACGTRDSHQMMILTGPQSISELLGVNQEWIAQEFLNHNATIYKVYVIGDFCEVTPRLSLPDFPNDYSVDECIHFNSHDPIPSSMFSAHSAEDCKSPIGSEKPLMQRKGISRIASIDNTILNDPNRTRSPLVRGSRGKEFELWNSISTQLRDRLKLDLFGYDVIIHSESGLFYVVDINYFPSYKNISQFPELLLSYLLIRLSGSPFLYKQFI